MRCVSTCSVAFAWLAIVASSASAQSQGGELDVKVEVLDTGKAPLQVLRYSFQPGATQSIKITSKCEGIEGQEDVKKTEKYTLHRTLKVNLEDTMAGGIAKFSLQLNEMSVDVDPSNMRPEIMDLRAKCQALIGSTWSGTLSNRGELLSSNTKLPNKVEKNLKDLTTRFQEELQVMQVPFPNEAIGVGAIWRCVKQKSVGTGDMGILETYTYELKSVDERGAQVASTMIVSLNTQKSPQLGIPLLLQAKFTSLEASCEATYSLTFDSVFPKRVSWYSNADAAYEASMLGKAISGTSNKKNWTELTSLDD